MAPRRNTSLHLAGLLLAFFLFGSGVGVSFAQDNCGASRSKKTAKLLERATSSRGGTLSERIDLLRQSVEMEPDCAECMLTKARAEYQLAAERTGDYSRAYADFRNLVRTCPNYHADAYYYTGIIAYANQEYEVAKSSFEAFVKGDTEHKSRDYETKLEDVQSVLPEVQFYVNFYANPVPYNPKSLVHVNTEADEYLPMLNPDNELLFFTRQSKEKAKGDLFARTVERFMQAGKDPRKGEFVNPEPLPPPFNVGDNYGGVSISLNNREMFVTVCKVTAVNYNNCDIYVTRYERTVDQNGEVHYRWSGLENLGDAVNTPDGWEAQPTLSADGNTLYFATIRKGTTPDKDGNPTIDIYFTERGADGRWSQARPLDGHINSAGNDKSPFLHVDSRTMYFSSNGRPGAGGYDIYFSKQDDDGNWSEPENIGYPINSPQDEHGLVVSTDGKHAFFASSNVAAARGLDLFRFEMPEGARPEKVLIVKGDIKDSSGEVIPDARIELKYAESKTVEEVEVDRYDGSYSAVLNLHRGEDIVMSVKSDSSTIAFNSRVFTLADTAEAVVDLAMELEQVEEGKAYRMNDIRFATASSQIDEASKRVLDDFAEYLKENPRVQIVIEGHTDNVGNAHSNLILSKDRAFEVFGYLQDVGVDPRRMKFEGFGQTRPVAPNDSEENRALNRRTEFRITRL